MIELVFQRDNNRWCSFQSKGHSGYKNSGEDIVCAAISAIVQTALLGIKAFDKEISSYVIEDGFLEWNLTTKTEFEFDVQIQSIITAAILGCLNIAVQYPEFVSVKLNGLFGWKNCKNYELQDLNQLIELLK